MNKFMTLIAGLIFAFILWAIYQANMGYTNMLFSYVRSIPSGDKLGHFILFGVLTLSLILASRFHVIHLAKLRVYTAVILVSLFVLVEEISQAFIPSRTFELVDLAADSAGISLAIIIALVIRSFSANKPDNPQLS